jgi:hypothetical protein
MKTILNSITMAGFALTACANSVVFETPAFQYTISPNGTNLSFIDRASGKDFLRTTPPSACAVIRTHNDTQPATAATFLEGRLTLRFGDSGIEAVLKTETRPSHIALTVESISGSEVQTLTFLNVPLTLNGLPDESFGACALALNLITRVDALPALQEELQASCEKKFGIIGAKVAIVAAPMEKMLPTLQQTLSDASELPVCKVAGPWARETPFAQGSYLFNFGFLLETNVETWIAMTRSVGFTQIDNHGGSTEFFRFGDMELNREKWPDGWASFRRIVSKLHDAGIGSIFHTYAFFIDKQSKYVTPVPDPRLDAFRTFTLAEPLSENATEITVNESTAEMKTITGFVEQNSLVLHIGDELVTFGGASKEAPWKFTGVQRGALGTKATAHARGAKARHLKELFGLFVPNVETTLFDEIAANHARVVNECGFDGIYLDAIDGSGILRGGPEIWYWSQKFVVEIQKRLKKPVGMEMSAMAHHFWQYRTRWQAWDYPQRGHKRFIDLHAEDVNGGLLLPLHLGWWSFQSFDPPQSEPTYPDVMEHLGARLIGWDAGVSLTTSVSRGALRNTPLFQRAVDILKTCEDLRRDNVFDEATKAKLRDPNSEFALFKDAAGKSRFRRVKCTTQTMALGEPWTLTWRATNNFAAQPARFRIEALMAANPSDTNAIILADLGRGEADSWKRTTAVGVGFALTPHGNSTRGGCLLTATNAGQVPRNAAWARLTKQFEPLLNLKGQQGLGVEIDGDGSGALVAIRLESPHHLAHGGIADRYILLDFIGRRTFTLVETESTRWSDYIWNDRKTLYNAYRETANFDAIESASVWLQNLPAGRETKIAVGPIRAVPLRSASVANPKIRVARKTIEFPVKLAAGSWIEANGPEDCVLYGSKGESLGKVTPRGEWPTLGVGHNELQFTCESDTGVQPRLRIVTIANGEAL